MKRVAGILLLAAILAVPLAVLFPRGALLPSGDVAARDALESYTRDNFPFRNLLESFAADLLVAGGMREVNGVFVGGEAMIKNIPAPGEDTLKRNFEAVESFAGYARQFGKQVYFALIPTAAAVSGGNIPYYAEVLDQRALIEDVYGRLAGKLMTVDIWLPLYTNREKYIYYRTENNLTAYGGFYVYTAMIKRMLGVSGSTYNSYEVAYGSREYYGDLYSGSLFKRVVPDTLILYKYSAGANEHIVEHRDYSGVKTYHTLYPSHITALGRDMDIYLGGLSAVVDIKTSLPEQRNLELLLFGDKTALSYLPMLSNHYNRVTFVDISGDDLALDYIDIDGYDQILIAYSVETYAAQVSVLQRLGIFIEN